MTSSPAQLVLERFAEADMLLREAQQQVIGLTSARAAAEASAASLAAAAAAVSAYADAAKSATEMTQQVHEQAAQSLREAEALSRSFDASQILAAMASLKTQIEESDARAEAAQDALHERLLLIEEALAVPPYPFDALSRRLTKHVTTQASEVRADVEALKALLEEAEVDAAKQRLRLEEQVGSLSDRLEAGLRSVQASESEGAEVLTGIVDVLPRRSRRKLSR